MSEHRKINPMDGLARMVGQSPEDYQNQASEWYEDQIVNHFFLRYGLPAKTKYRMLDEHHDRLGIRRLTLQAFHEHFPSFPAYLQARKEASFHKDATIARLFSNFADRKLTKAYEEVWSERPEFAQDMTVGMIFHWPYLRGTTKVNGKRESHGGIGLVIHNGELEPSYRIPGMRLLWVSPSKQLLTVEPLGSFLRMLDRHATGSANRKWQPTDE